MMKLNSTSRNALNRNGDWEAFSDHLGLERELIKVNIIYPMIMGGVFISL